MPYFTRTLTDHVWGGMMLTGAAVGFGLWQETLYGAVFVFCLLDLISPILRK